MIEKEKGPVCSEINMILDDPQTTALDQNVRTLFNPIDLYLYRITRFNDVTVYYDTLKQSLKFCLWDSEEKLIKDELLSVSYRTENDTIEAEGKKLLKTESGTYYYKITNYGKDFGITDEGVKSSFIVIN